MLSRVPRTLFCTATAALLLGLCAGIAQAKDNDADSLYYSEPDTEFQIPPMVVTRPTLQSLISIDTTLDPFQLDATGQRQITLNDVVDLALRSNLKMQISQQDVNVSRWKLLNSYSQFLPAARLGYMWNYLHGHIRLPIAMPGGSNPISIDTPFIIARAGVEYKAFQGGKVLFTALQNRNNLRSSRWQYRATTNDVLAEAARRYYDLLLNQGLLQIRIRAVATAEEQLRLNENLEKEGMATHLDVLQAQTQLSNDRQNLIDQQIVRRKAAIQLADYLNIDQAIDLEPAAIPVEPIRLIDEKLPAGKLLAAAISGRPELKSFQEQVLSARKNVQIAAAPLFPTVTLSATEYGIGETLTNKKRTLIAPASTTSSLAPISLNSAGAATSTSAAAAPRLITQSRQLTGLGVLAVNVDWQLHGFGLEDYTNIQQARSQIRQAQLKANEQANTVINQVRKSYLDQLGAWRRTQENTNRVTSAAEELRLAQLRLQSGMGKNIDILRAQQDLVDALVEHAHTSIEFTKAQVQLLHDIGMISRERLLSTAPLML